MSEKVFVRQKSMREKGTMSYIELNHDQELTSFLLIIRARFRISALISKVRLPKTTLATSKEELDFAFGALNCSNVPNSQA